MGKNANKVQKISDIDFDVAKFHSDLLNWYEAQQRTLPWRLDKRRFSDKRPEPYHVWLSEIMLQQTVVATVIPYFLKFVNKWPNVHALANADNEEIMREWAGLGYYARARNLHKCAKVVSEEHNGIFPEDKSALLKLPGIGEYTASAILAIAFDKDIAVVDGNIERVLSRLFMITEPLPQSKPIIHSYAQILAKDLRGKAGCYTQALMDLGASVCIPKSPKCMICPIKSSCAAQSAGIAAELPYKKQKKKKPYKYGYIYWVENNEGEILLERRDERGLLGGMMAFPTSEWLEKKPSLTQKPAELEHTSDIQTLKDEKIYHSFTHFDLELQSVSGVLERANLEGNSNKAFRWVSKDDILDVGLPSVFLKFAKMKLK